MNFAGVHGRRKRLACASPVHEACLDVLGYVWAMCGRCVSAGQYISKGCTATCVGRASHAARGTSAGLVLGLDSRTFSREKGSDRSSGSTPAGAAGETSKWQGTR